MSQCGFFGDLFMVSDEIVLFGGIVAGILALIAASSLFFANSVKHRILGAWVLAGVLCFTGGYWLFLIDWPVIVKVVCMLLYIFVAFDAIRSAKRKWLDS
jgi:ABC-type Mn2+/Zn2+ transport system permease subunit